MNSNTDQTTPREKWLLGYEQYKTTVIQKPDGSIEVIRDPKQPVLIQPGLPDGLKRLM